MKLGAAACIALLPALVPPTEAYASGTAAAADGQKLFQLRCVRCHSVERLKPNLAARPLEQRRAELEKFMRGHYARDPSERASIADWLAREVEPGR